MKNGQIRIAIIALIILVQDSWPMWMLSNSDGSEFLSDYVSEQKSARNLHNSGKRKQFLA